jgi:hypothetical protein
MKSRVSSALLTRLVKSAQLKLAPYSERIDAGTPAGAHLEGRLNARPAMNQN